VAVDPSSMLEWSVQLHDYAVCPETRLVVRVGGRWWMCKKDQFPTAARGDASLRQFTVISMVLSDGRCGFSPPSSPLCRAWLRHVGNQ
jgi:hypothetical protein